MLDDSNCFFSFSLHPVSLSLHSISFSIFWKVLLNHNCNWTRTQNHLVHKQTLNHFASLAKWLSVHLRTKWFWVQVQLQSLKIQILHLLSAKSSLTFRQLWIVDSRWNAYVNDKNIQSSESSFFLWPSNHYKF